MNTRSKLFLLSSLLLATGSMWACGDGHPSTPATQPEPIRAASAPAERLEIPQRVEIHGRVEAKRSAAVAARVMAMVTAVHVREGDRVTAGQLLLEIDPQAAKGQVAQATGALSQARAALTLAERNYERFRALAEKNAASELEVDRARMQYEQAAGAVEQARGAVAAARSVAADTTVVAPFAGQISRKMVDVGDLAAPGRPLMMVESLQGRRLAVAIPETLLQAADLSIGDAVPVQIDARPDLGVLTATVAEMAPGADPSSHSVAAKLDLPIDRVATGAAGRAWLETEMRSAVAVPRAAVLRQGGLDLVVVRNAQGVAETRVVTLGRVLSDERIEVLSGLSGDETVLTGLVTAPPAGSPVEPLS